MTTNINWFDPVFYPTDLLDCSNPTASITYNSNSQTVEPLHLKTDQCFFSSFMSDNMCDLYPQIDLVSCINIMSIVCFYQY